MFEVLIIIILNVVLISALFNGYMWYKSSKIDHNITIKCEMLNNVEIVELNHKYRGKFNIGSIIIHNGIEYGIYNVDITVLEGKISIIILCKAIDKTIKKLNDEEDYS